MNATKRKAPELRRQSLDYDTNAAGDESGISCPEPTLAQQQFAEESDINFIADRYGLSGEMPQVTNPPRYGDFSGIFDYQTAHNAVIAANAKFMEFPAKLRARFNNDPQQLITFLENEDNRPEAEFLGLVPKRTQEPPQSPQGDPGAQGKGDTLSPAPEAPGKPPKPPKTDT